MCVCVYNATVKQFTIHLEFNDALKIYAYFHITLRLYIRLCFTNSNNLFYIFYNLYET